MPFIQLGGSKDPVAFCHNPKHKFTLSKQQLKTKGCLGKQCPYLERFKNHPFWILREEKKKLKKNRGKKFT